MKVSHEFPRTVSVSQSKRLFNINHQSLATTNHQGSLHTTNHHKPGHQLLIAYPWGRNKPQSSQHGSSRVGWEVGAEGRNQPEGFTHKTFSSTMHCGNSIFGSATYPGHIEAPLSSSGFVHAKDNNKQRSPQCQLDSQYAIYLWQVANVNHCGRPSL